MEKMKENFVGDQALARRSKGGNLTEKNTVKA